jgi:hypothetical protein
MVSAQPKTASGSRAALVQATWFCMSIWAIGLGVLALLA